MSSDKHLIDKIIVLIVDHLTEALPIAQPDVKFPDEDYKKMQIKDEALSIRKLATNFQKLGKKVGYITDFFASLGDIFTWRRSDRSLAFLLLYTWACIHPQFIIVYPIMYILGFMGKKYIERHIIKSKPILITVNDYSDSFNYTDDGLSRLFVTNKYVSEDTLFGWLWGTNPAQESPSVNFNKNTLSTEDTIEISPLETNDQSEDDEDRASFLQTLKDIQNKTTDILEQIDSWETSFINHCNFLNEKLSAIIYIKVLLASFFIIILGPLIPWRIIFIASMWSGMILSHPQKKLFFERISKLKTKRNVVSTSKMEQPSKINGEAHQKSQGDGLFSSQQIILDDPICYKLCQIFEIQKQDITNPNKYQSSMYSTSPFTVSNEQRKKRKFPRYTANISEIIAPEGWQFSDNSNWKSDPPETIQHWISDMSINDSVFIEKGWVYDISGEFRRRRFSRQIMKP